MAQWSREQAWELLTRYNREPFHLQHARTVEGVLRYFARQLGYGEEEDFWGLAGLLHDLDFEQYPDQHCIRCQEILRENSHLSIAYKSIGRAYFQQGDSAAAMEMLKKGDDPYFYSMALKDYRKEFVRRHFVWLLLGAAAGLTLFIFLIKKAHRWMLSGKSGKRIRRR